MTQKKDGFGLAAFLLVSGVLARLQSKRVLLPDETRHLIDHAITTLLAGRRGR